MNAVNPPMAQSAALAPETACMSTVLQPPPLALTTEPAHRTLRRTGRKPVRFTGWQLVEAIGTQAADRLNYDLNIYRTCSDAVVVELSARRGAVQAADLLRVEIFTNIDDAATWLQSYPCAADVPVPSDFDTDAPLALSMVQAVRLRQHIGRVQEDFQGLLSDVFMALGLADSADDLLAVSSHVDPA